MSSDRDVVSRHHDEDWDRGCDEEIRRLNQKIDYGFVNSSLLDAEIQSMKARPSDGDARRPSSLAELQVLHDEAMTDVRRAQTHLLDEIDWTQQQKRRRLDWDSYWNLRDWVQDLDVGTGGIDQELEEARVNLKRAGQHELAFAVLLLQGACWRRDNYRSLIDENQRRRLDDAETRTRARIPVRAEAEAAKRAALGLLAAAELPDEFQNDWRERLEKVSSGSTDPLKELNKLLAEMAGLRKRPYRAVGRNEPGRQHRLVSGLGAVIRAVETLRARMLDAPAP